MGMKFTMGELERKPDHKTNMNEKDNNDPYILSFEWWSWLQMRINTQHISISNFSIPLQYGGRVLFIKWALSLSLSLIYYVVEGRGRKYLFHQRSPPSFWGVSEWIGGEHCFGRSFNIKCGLIGRYSHVMWR